MSLLHSLYWQIGNSYASPNGEVVEDPINDFDFRAPTLDEDENPTTPKLHNYDDIFPACQAFTGMSRLQWEDGSSKYK